MFTMFTMFTMFACFIPPVKNEVHESEDTFRQIEKLERSYAAHREADAKANAEAEAKAKVEAEAEAKVAAEAKAKATAANVAEYDEHIARSKAMRLASEAAAAATAAAAAAAKAKKLREYKEAIFEKYLKKYKGDLAEAFYWYGEDEVQKDRNSTYTTYHVEVLSYSSSPRSCI